jgi:hypothetical protein
MDVKNLFRPHGRKTLVAGRCHPSKTPGALFPMPIEIGERVATSLGLEAPMQNRTTEFSFENERPNGRSGEQYEMARGAKEDKLGADQTDR